ncbi:acetate--CoA ligase [Tepidibacillus decaturensis]|uniref:acetate--CoA ligase n=1 Tax=Tepidibacillus decaturensis TaxID=1413211 RepID=A0A135L4T6_9BACI|nr:acetate--CoA ligase [Tepidibacillus decaturensis]KXG44018.1 acetyl-CoA synthetase [Tepidibacillus decaturensis]
MKNANIGNYEETYHRFQWTDAEKHFTWAKTDKVNIVYEAIDRHVEEGKGDHPAILYWDGQREETYTFADLKQLSSQFANGLKNYGIQQGDRVFLFMPRSPELMISLLGIIRIGAIAGPLFEAFMEEAIKDRLLDSGAVAIVTTHQLLSRIPISELHELKYVILVGSEEVESPNQVLYQDLMNHSQEYTIEWVSRETPMLIHYTSGSTGKPKGVLQVHDAMLHQYMAGKWVYDLKETDIYWCTADPGWVTGTSAGIFSPWLNGVPIVVRGGRFSVDDWYKTIEKYQVTVWFSAPTAFRMLMREGNEIPRRYDLSTLRHILSAGEPLNAEVIRWGEEVFQQPIYDNWWMTETGASICANYKTIPIRPGSMGKPIPGIRLAIVDDKGKELPPYEMGNLAIKKPWPAMLRTIWNNPERYQEYFINDWFISGDKAYRDKDGYFWFQGRKDDVINTSGERVGPFEVESKLIEHWAVAEAGVIGIPDELRGEVVKAFITVKNGVVPTEKLKEEIRQFVKENLAAHAAPRQIEFIDTLPKTRSGKIMRRVLKAWELGLPPGDLSTMEV